MQISNAMGRGDHPGSELSGRRILVRKQVEESCDSGEGCKRRKTVILARETEGGVSEYTSFAIRTLLMFCADDCEGHHHQGVYSP
jgi:hypothetical protein